jgi:hypothetical protein
MVLLDAEQLLEVFGTDQLAGEIAARWGRLPHLGAAPSRESVLAALRTASSVEKPARVSG